jgi:hypothetical protein
MDSGAVSTTFTVAVQELLLPAASVTVTTTLCAPTPTNVPAAGSCVTTNPAAGVHPSLATTVARKSGTAV